MTSNLQSLKTFLATANGFALVEVTGTKGSTPRETGATMLVSAMTTFGTIGGGQLEFMAIDKARDILSLPDLTPHRNSQLKAGADQEDVHETLDVPLGPEIGQCCGGRVEVLIRLGSAALESELMKKAESEDAVRPHIYIFGGGHVGHAMAQTCALMPVRPIVVDTRADALTGLPSGIETRLTPMPEEVVRAAPAGAAFAVLTHDHALDFLIVAEALRRDDAAYVGMIGSKTKKATFKNWFLKTANGTDAEFSRLVSPIGGQTVKDKRPNVIAALAAAEIMTALANCASNAPASEALTGAQ